MTKRGQISIEYLVVVGFITFLVLSVLGIAFYYSSGIRDTITDNEVSDYASKIVSSSETVFYSGEPSKLTVSVYLPQYVTGVSFVDNMLVVDYTTRAGPSRRGFSSDVPITGTLTANPGIHRITLVAQSDRVAVSEA